MVKCIAIRVKNRVSYVKTLTCSLKVSGSIVNWDICYPGCDFVVLLSSTRTQMPIGTSYYDLVLPHALQFVIH